MYLAIGLYINICTYIIFILYIYIYHMSICMYIISFMYIEQRLWLWNNFLQFVRGRGVGSGGGEVGWSVGTTPPMLGAPDVQQICSKHFCLGKIVQGKYVLCLKCTSVLYRYAIHAVFFTPYHARLPHHSMNYIALNSLHNITYTQIHILHAERMQT